VGSPENEQARQLFTKAKESKTMSNVQNNDNQSTPSARRMTDIIDVHSYIITNLGSQAPMDKLPPWSIEQSLSVMNANGISASVLSLPDSVNHAKGPKGCQRARQINAQLADIVSKHPTRFGAMATLPAQAATDGVLEEMAHALDTLKLDGVATTTSIERYLHRGIETPLNASLCARRVGKLRNSEKGSDILPPRALTSRE
jgi:predicted TIM-barrel fold metal-dependent hydrolase